MNLWRTAAYFSAYIVSRLVPRPVGDKIADAVSFLAHALKRKERACVRRNLSVLMGMPEDAPEVIAAARNVYRNFGRACTELLYATRSRTKPFVPALKILGQEHLERALALGKGVILAGAHTGHWEMGAMALAGRGYPITVLAHAPALGVAGLYRRQREATGLKMIDTAASGLMRCVRVLQRGEILGIMADRRLGFGGFEEKLFGRTASLPQGTVRLSIACGSPIVGATLRLSGGVPTLRFYGRIEPPGAATPDAQALVGRKVARLMETMILEAPEEWFCFEDPWKP